MIIFHVLFVGLIVVFSLFSPKVVAQIEQAIEAPVNEISIERKYGFSLKADYFSGQKKSDGVLILHDCGSDRLAYQPITEQLVKQELHILALDLRGFGNSTSSTFSHNLIKHSAKDIIDYQQQLAKITSYWEEDVFVAFEFLRSKLAKEASVSILASGCSAPYAVAIAEKMHINNMVMLTPKMSYAEKERYKNLTDIPTYFIASVHHVNTYQTAKELFEWNGHVRSKKLKFKGNYINAQLLKSNKALAYDIARWFSE